MTVLVRMYDVSCMSATNLSVMQSLVELGYVAQGASSSLLKHQQKHPPKNQRPRRRKLLLRRQLQGASRRSYAIWVARALQKVRLVVHTSGIFD